MIKFKINDIQMTLNLLKTYYKITILEACLNVGIYIPHFCYNKSLLISGNCRICIVEIEKLVKPIISCLNLCVDNLNIFTNTFSIKKFRENVLEFLLINHPLDCPICDQAGECDLQEQTLYFGLERSRFFLKKKVNSDIFLNNYIKLILNRCILCVRCVRFLRETNINNEYINLLGTIGRGSFSKIHLYTSSKINYLGSGNIIDICPVGALTLKLNQFVSRPWELNSIINFDIFDSFGLPIQIDFKHLEIVRILPVLDSIFFLDYISDYTRFKFIEYNKWFKLLNNSSNDLSFDFSGKYLFGLFKKVLIFNLPNNCLVSYKHLNFIFCNIIGFFKYFDSIINIYYDFLNFYLLTFSLIFTFFKFSLILINTNLKNYMFRFFIYLNEIVKIYNNIYYFLTEDLNILYLNEIFKSNSYIIFLNSNYFKYNIFNNLVYIIKYLSFFKILLSFDNIYLFKMNKYNLNYCNKITYIGFNKINYSFKNKLLSIFTFKFEKLNYNINLIYNVFGMNVNNNNQQLLNFKKNIKNFYNNNIKKILKKQLIQC